MIEGSKFESGEEAWFWAYQCLKMRQEGARSNGSGVLRVCEPGDVIFAMSGLERRGRLSKEQIAVLVTHADIGARPAPGTVDRALWDSAMEIVHKLLRIKEIVR